MCPLCKYGEVRNGKCVDCGYKVPVVVKDSSALSLMEANPMNEFKPQKEA